jgi:hypothetical protein
MPVNSVAENVLGTIGMSAILGTLRLIINGGSRNSIVDRTTCPTSMEKLA